MFNVVDMRNGSSNPLSWNTSKNGDWHLEANTSTLYYLGMYSLGRVIFLPNNFPKDKNNFLIEICDTQ